MVAEANSPQRGNCPISANGWRTAGGGKILGRWHGSNLGYVLAETSDTRAMYEWTARWDDLLEFVVTPVVEDADAADVMKRTIAKPGRRQKRN